MSFVTESVPSLRILIIQSLIYEYIYRSTPLKILEREYGEKWLFLFLGNLSPCDLKDLLQDREIYDKSTFIKIMKLTDFTQTSYKDFAQSVKDHILSLEYHGTGVLARRKDLRNKFLNVEFVLNILRNMTPNLKKKFLNDYFYVSDKDLIRLSKGEVTYRSIRRRIIREMHNLIARKFPFIPKNRRYLLAKSLNTCDMLNEYRKDIDVNINGVSHPGTFHAITLRDNSDQNSIPVDFAYIFIVLHETGKYIEHICQCIDFHDEDVSILYSPTTLLINQSIESKVYIYPKNCNEILLDLIISDSTKLTNKFRDLVSVDIEETDRPDNYYPYMD